MHNKSLPFSSTVLLRVKFERYSKVFDTGVFNSHIPWETWLTTSVNTLKPIVEAQVRKWYLAKHIPCTWELASTIPNKILCAAVWHKTFNANISRPLNLEFGTVFTGRRHSNCYEQIITFDVPVKHLDCVDGFLTENNVFLTREQAYLVACVNKQLLSHCTEIVSASILNNQILISEMLY
jgi:hypothetical protein